MGHAVATGRRLALRLAALALALSVPLGTARAGTVLDRVKTAGALSCGVLTEPEDYGKDDVHAGLPAFDRDICRAVAVAVLGSPDKAKLVQLPAEQAGYAALRAGRIDVLMGATPSPTATLAFGVAFTRPAFLDGAGVLVPAAGGIARFEDLAGKLVCYVPGTEASASLESEAERRHVKLLPWPFEERGELLAAVAGGKCDAMAGSVSRLMSDRNFFHGRAKTFVLLAERLSVVPMAPAVETGDPAWAEVVDAVVDAPLLAESAGLARADASSLGDTQDPMLRGLAGLLPGIEPGIVERGWGIRVVGLIGNYAELYDRDLGSGSDLAIPRATNALWDRGGLMAPQPIR